MYTNFCMLTHAEYMENLKKNNFIILFDIIIQHHSYEVLCTNSYISKISMQHDIEEKHLIMIIFSVIYQKIQIHN